MVSVAYIVALWCRILGAIKQADSICEEESVWSRIADEIYFAQRDNLQIGVSKTDSTLEDLQSEAYKKQRIFLFRWSLENLEDRHYHALAKMLSTHLIVDVPSMEFAESVFPHFQRRQLCPMLITRVYASIVLAHVRVNKGTLANYIGFSFWQLFSLQEIMGLYNILHLDEPKSFSASPYRRFIINAILSRGSKKVYSLPLSDYQMIFADDNDYKALYGSFRFISYTFPFARGHQPAPDPKAHECGEFIMTTFLRRGNTSSTELPPHVWPIYVTGEAVLSFLRRPPGETADVRALLERALLGENLYLTTPGKIAVLIAQKLFGSAHDDEILTELMRMDFPNLPFIYERRGCSSYFRRTFFDKEGILLQRSISIVRMLSKEDNIPNLVLSVLAQESGRQRNDIRSQ